MSDSKLWEEAYKSYKKHFPDVDRIPNKHNKNQKVQTKRSWLQTHKEFLRFKKTEKFQKWRYKQFLRQGGYLLLLRHAA